MDQKARIEVPVTQKLRSRVQDLKQDWGIGWREMAQRIVGWEWSHALLHKIAHGHQEYVRVEVYDALGVDPPIIPITLENVNRMQISVQALSYFLERAHLGNCAVDGCDGRFYQIGNAKYCPRHSWATPEGRRYWRKNKKAG